MAVTSGFATGIAVSIMATQAADYPGSMPQRRRRRAGLPPGCNLGTKIEPGNWAWKVPTLLDAELNALTVSSIFAMRFSLSAIFFLVSQNLLGAQAAEVRPRVEILISVVEQRLALVHDGVVVRRFPVSTSKFGLGDSFGSYKTPLGRLRVCGKLGGDLPEGAVFKHRNFSGEVLRVNARGRDPIVTRILWLEGAEPSNRNARHRCIYIHGTPQERSIGKATSYGCVRMRSRDVVEIFNAVPVGTPVTITTKKLPRVQRPEPFKLVVSLAGLRSQSGT